MVHAGKIPWHDFYAEYPPLGVYLMALPGVFGLHLSSLGWVTTLATASFVVTIFTAIYVAKYYSTSKGTLSPVVTSAVIVTILATCKDSWLLWNETIPTCLCLITGLAVLRTTKPMVAGILVLVFVQFALAKIYLLLGLPFLLMALYSRPNVSNQYKTTASIGLSASMLLTIGWAISHPEALKYFVNFHRARTIEVYSTYAAAIALFRPGHDLGTVFRYGSIELQMPFPIINALSSLMLVTGLVTTTLIFRNYLKNDINPNRAQGFAISYFAVMAFFFAFNKVGSPNYILVPTILCFGFLPSITDRRHFVAIIVALGLMSVGVRCSYDMFTLTQDIKSIGLKTPIFSLIKALGFITAFLCGIYGLRRSRPKGRQSEGMEIMGDPLLSNV